VTAASDLVNIMLMYTCTCILWGWCSHYINHNAVVNFYDSPRTGRL